jgi:hypothetical protein
MWLLPPQRRERRTSVGIGRSPTFLRPCRALGSSELSHAEAGEILTLVYDWLTEVTQASEQMTLAMLDS